MNPQSRKQEMQYLKLLMIALAAFAAAVLLLKYNL
jgi:hypothetical protein